MRTWEVIQTGEYPQVRFTEVAPGVQCDHCGKIVPECYVDYVFESPYIPRDGRQGRYAICRDVFGSLGMVHRRCTP